MWEYDPPTLLFFLRRCLLIQANYNTWLLIDSISSAQHLRNFESILIQHLRAINKKKLLDHNRCSEDGPRIPFKIAQIDYWWASHVLFALCLTTTGREEKKESKQCVNMRPTKRRRRRRKVPICIYIERGTRPSSYKRNPIDLSQWCTLASTSILSDEYYMDALLFRGHQPTGTCWAMGYTYSIIIIVIVSFFRVFSPLVNSWAHAMWISILSPHKVFFWNNFSRRCAEGKSPAV